MSDRRRITREDLDVLGREEHELRERLRRTKKRQRRGLTPLAADHAPPLEQMLTGNGERTPTAPAAAGAWIPILNGTRPSNCKTCGDIVYWSITTVGRNVPVTVAVDGGIAPTKNVRGRGVDHRVDCKYREQPRTGRPSKKKPVQTELL
jgi:hypothetical protein